MSDLASPEISPQPEIKKSQELPSDFRQIFGLYLTDRIGPDVAHLEQGFQTLQGSSTIPEKRQKYVERGQDVPGQLRDFLQRLSFSKEAAVTHSLNADGSVPPDNNAELKLSSELTPSSIPDIGNAELTGPLAQDLGVIMSHEVGSRLTLVTPTQLLRSLEDVEVQTAVSQIHQATQNIDEIVGGFKDASRIAVSKDEEGFHLDIDHLPTPPEPVVD
jgi:hypothetical protein